VTHSALKPFLFLNSYQALTMQQGEKSNAHQQAHQERRWRTFETLNLDNLVLRALPIDPVTENYVREVKNACFSRVAPTPLKNPAMVVYSESAMGLLDLNNQELQVNRLYASFNY
jgi:hypothetical protein